MVGLSRSTAAPLAERSLPVPEADICQTWPAPDALAAPEPCASLCEAFAKPTPVWESLPKSVLTNALQSSARDVGAPKIINAATPERPAAPPIPAIGGNDPIDRRLSNISIIAGLPEMPDIKRAFQNVLRMTAPCKPPPEMRDAI